MTTVKSLALVALLLCGTSLAMAQTDPATDGHPPAAPGPPGAGVTPGPAPQATAPNPNLGAAAPAPRASSGTRVAHRTRHTRLYMVARPDQYPTLDVAPLCRGITDQSSLQEGLRTVTFDECMKAEQADRDTMIKEWATFSSDDKRHCIAEATMGGESSYTDLVTCLEMARDVRQLHNQANSSSAPAQQNSSSAPDQQVPPAPAGHRQPTRQ